MKPLVSILIPAYNAEKWIKDTIQSALAQTWTNKEIIVVDDGSSDNTFKIAKEFESKSLKVITQTNRGASNARNRAFAESQGDFIQWLDADDLLAPDKITLQLADIGNSPDTKVLYSSAFGRFYLRPHKTKFRATPLWQDLSPLDFLIKSFEGGWWMQPASWLVSRKVNDLAGSWNERLSLSDDGEYFCRIVASSNFVRFNLKARCYYRSGNIGSLSWKRSEKALLSLSHANNLRVDHLLSLNDSETTRKACVDLLNRTISQIYPENPSNIIESNYQRIVELGSDIMPPFETRRFYCFRKILGWKRAKFLKIWIWEREISIRKRIDKILSQL